MADIRVTELDFQQIKENIINYLKAQDEFSDYNFTGSGLNVLLDILAYNTHYNAILAHLQSNEMFIDTAIKRSSVVSIAKTLGYTPRSVQSSKATVNVNVISAEDGPLTIPRFTKFSTSVNDQSFTFVTTDSHIAYKEAGEFLFEGIELIEGSVIEERTVVGVDTVSGPIKIRNNNIDLNTLAVTVQTSATNLTTTVFTRTTSIVDITRDSKVFWVEESQDGFYQLLFGDDIVGKKLTVGNIVTVQYVASRGAEANGAQSFSCSIRIGGASPVTTLVSASAGGSFRESTESIKFNAPRFHTTQNRAVTVEDYKSLILSNFDKAKSVAVWGGEQNVPPIYGKVFISIDPKDNYIITQTDKDHLLNSVLRPRSVLSILHEFVDPVYLYVGLNVKVNYDALITPFSNAEIESIVTEQIQDYFANELSTLDKRFYYARLLNKIQTSHNAIIGTLIDMRLQRRIVPILNVHERLKFYFTTSVEPNSFKSTYFTTIVAGTQYTAYIQDFPTTTPPDKNGRGVLKLVNQENNQVLVADYGTIQYAAAGEVEIPDFYVTDLLSTDIRFNALPQELAKDLSPTIIRGTPETAAAVYPYPSQNIIVTLDDSENNLGVGTQAGLRVTATPSEI
jgi:hypothetical protein